jgi:hypothetical protein
VGTNTCSGGRTCFSSGCDCPGGQLWCAGANQCQPLATACANVACQQCGFAPACDGATITDPATNYTGLCATSLSSCSAANSQSSATDARYYKAGADPTPFFWVCAKVARNPWTSSVYGWNRRIPSVGQLGAGPNGCTQGGYYATCDFVCVDKLGFRGFCNGTVLTTNLGSSTSFGCLDYTNLTAAQDCP